MHCLDEIGDLEDYERNGILRYLLNLNAQERDYSVIATLTPKDTKGTCVYCKHCHPCPAGLDIGLINKYYDLSRLGDVAGEGALSDARKGRLRLPAMRPLQQPLSLLRRPDGADGGDSGVFWKIASAPKAPCGGWYGSMPVTAVRGKGALRMWVCRLPVHIAPAGCTVFYETPRRIHNFPTGRCGHRPLQSAAGIRGCSSGGQRRPPLLDRSSQINRGPAGSASSLRAAVCYMDGQM